MSSKNKTQFSILNFLLLTALVAVGIFAYMNHAHQQQRIEQLQTETVKSRDTIDLLRKRIEIHSKLRDQNWLNNKILEEKAAPLKRFTTSQSTPSSYESAFYGQLTP